MFSKTVVLGSVVLGMLLASPGSSRAPSAESVPNEKPGFQPSEFRTWSDVTGRYKIDAALVGVESGKIRLKKRDGNLVIVDMERLSNADRDFVRSYVGRTGTSAARAPAAPQRAPATPSPMPRPNLSGPPKISATVGWESSGSGHNEPYRYKTALSLESSDASTWTVVPDMLFAACSRSGSLAGAICRKDRSETREELRLPFRVDSAPTGENVGKGVTTLVVGNTFLATGFAAHWRPGGTEQPWQATDLRTRQRLECIWESLAGSDFKPEIKETSDFHLFHLGPVFYQSKDPHGVAYVLAARSAKPAGGGVKWQSTQQEFIALTAENVRRQIDDSTQPMPWRVQFAIWLWDQPRPCEDVDRVLQEIFEGPSQYPPAIRAAVAAGLLSRHCAPAVPALVAVARGKEAELDLRWAVVSQLHLMPDDAGVEPLSAIARDGGEEYLMRWTALRMLAKTGPAGWAVIEELKDDPEVGRPIRGILLKNRDEGKAK